MSFVAAATAIGFTGAGATIAAGAMMGATTTFAGNVIGGRDPFDNIGRGIVMGGITGGLTPGVKEAFEIGMPAAAGITAFGVNTLATGDIGKGLMAGATAYGLYGLSENMAAIGNAELSAFSNDALNTELANVNLSGDYFSDSLSSGNAVSSSSGEAFNKFLTSDANPAINSTPSSRMSTGFDAVTKSPSTMGQFAKDNAKNLMYVATPLLADAGVRSNMPTTTTRPGAMRRFSYDPYGQLYTPIGNYEVPVKAAGGGLMGMNDGGYSPGELDFAQRSEPVVRMARGGIAHYEEGGLTAEEAQKLVDAQYATIGRTGVGTGAAQIDEVGRKNWTDALVGGTLKAADLGSRFSTAVTDYMAQNPADQYTNYVKDYQAKQAGTTGGGDIGFTSNAATTGGSTSLGNVGDINYVANDPGIIKNTNQYFANNPDVAAAFAVNNYGLTAEQFAQTHYDKYGSKEQRATPLTATSNSNAYLLANPDVAAAYAKNSYGMTPAELAAYHSTTYGNAEQRATPIAEAQNMVANMYRNVLGRDPDPEGLAFWSNAIAAGRSPESIYQDFLTSARANTELVTADQIKNKTFADATKAYTGYMQTNATDASNIVDDWVRNTLGREPTAADKQQQWYKDAFNSMRTVDQAKGLYGQFQTYAGAEAKTEIANRIAAIDAELKAKGLTEADLIKQTGKTKQQLATEGIDLGRNLIGASQLSPLSARTAFDLKAALKKLTPITTPQTYAPAGTTNPYGNATNPGDITKNADGTITVQPNIPGRPFGGFPGMASVRDAYTQGGGSLGYIPYAPKTIEEFEEKYGYKTPSGSKDAYDYLTGKTKYSATPFTETGEVMKPYVESVLGRPLPTSTKRVLFDPVTKTYKNNPDYIPVSYTDKGKKVYGLSGRDINSYIDTFKTGNSVPGQIAGQVSAAMAVPKWMVENNVTYAQLAEALGISVAEAKKRYPEAAATTASETPSKEGGLMKLAGGGMAGQFDLGGYSDGGRLLRGPGDGVSDSIPATIGNKRPARLADGEFVVPARIVSELGNGSTEAGARKLYAMMDRVQAARRGSIGKGKVAKNSRADKYLPA
jgi:hypothetical protein